MSTPSLLCLVVLALAAPLAEAQDVRPIPQPYGRVSAGWGLLDYRVEAEARPSTQKASAVGASVEVGVPVAPFSVFGLSGPRTLGVEVSLARGEIDGPGGPFPFTNLPRLSAWQSSVVAVSRTQLAAGPVDLSYGFGVGVSYSASYELTDTGVGEIRGGIPIALYDARRTRSVAPVFHLDAAIGHAFGPTFVGVGAAHTYGIVPGLPARADRLGIEVQQTF